MQMLGSKRCLFASVAVCAIALCVGSADAAAPESSLLDPAVADAFKIDAGVVVWLEVDRTPLVPVTVVVPIDGFEYTLDLVPHSIRTDDFAVYVQLPDGTIEEREPEPPQTFNGSVREVQGAIVSGSILHDGLTARVEMPDGEVFWIEPLAANLPNSAVDEHVVYNADDTRGHDGVCGVTAIPEISEGESEGPEISSAERITELAVDADLEYYNKWGPNTNDVVHRMELIIAIMNVQYARDVDIIHVISAAFVRTSRTYNSTDPGTLLNLFRNRWRNVEPERSTRRDVAHLFTNKNLNGNVIGIAFLPGICLNTGYGLVWSDFNNNRSCATDLSAHELGHNWNALHCDCSNPAYTMNPSIRCANRFHPNFTIPRIVSFRNSRACLGKLQGLDLPFFDDFPIEAFDVIKWTEVDGALVGNAVNPPSPPFAATLDRTDFIMSNVIDTSGVNPSASLKFSFWTEERFAEASDFFFAEYLNSSDVWTVVFTEDGDHGGNQDNFDFHEFTLPDDAKHANFRIRFRTVGGAADFWYVDDVSVSAGGSEICIVHGNPDWDREEPGTHVAFDDWAFGGYIDPKVESTDGTNLDLGKDTFTVVFSGEPFGSAGGGAITTGNFSVEETGAGPAPGVVSAIKSGNAVTVVLDRIITLSEWTTLVADVWSGDGVRIVDNGNEGEDVDECARLDIGFQPVDVNNDDCGQPLDLNRWLIAFITGPIHPSDVSKGIAADYLDVSRNGIPDPLDLSRIIAGLKGQSPFTKNWRNLCLNNPRP